MNTIEHMYSAGMTVNKIDQVLLCLVITSLSIQKKPRAKQPPPHLFPSIQSVKIRNRVYFKKTICSLHSHFKSFLLQRQTATPKKKKNKNKKSKKNGISNDSTNPQERKKVFCFRNSWSKRSKKKGQERGGRVNS